MHRKFRHDALLILFLCSWIPVAIAGALIVIQVRAEHTKRLEQAKSALNSQLLSAEAAADILLASRELNNFILVDAAVRPVASNQLAGRLALVTKRVPALSAMMVLDKTSNIIFTRPREALVSETGAGEEGFTLMNQNTVRYRRAIEYDRQNFPGPAATLQAYLVLHIDLRSWRQSLADAVTINHIDSQPSLSGIDLSVEDDNAINTWQVVPSLAGLVILLVFTSIVGLYLMHTQVVNPITKLTRAVTEKMGKAAPGLQQHHEIAMLEESFETYVRFERELQAKLLQQSTLAAIGRTTQMLAHDVRKPFAMLKSLLQLMRGAKDQADVNNLVQKLSPEIDRATQSVEGLIRDIMDVGSERESTCEAVLLSSLIQTTLVDAVRVHRGCEISVRYRFEHRHALSGDPVKLSRVFTNIIANAIEAMQGRGELWFETRHGTSSAPLMEIVVGNSGSFIADDKKEKIFDAFFTEGKGGGTGLGLAIVKKFVTDHGGTIHCRSSVTRGTEFIFTLPMNEATAHDYAEDLPKSSREIESVFDNVDAAPEATSNVRDDDATLAERIVDLAKQKQRPIKILIADDESLYRRALESQLTDSPLRPYVRLAFAHNGEEALTSATDNRFDLVIMDVNFGNEGIDGFDAARRLRAEGYRGYLCIHSNCSVFEYRRKATTAGADLFLLKPMSQTRLYTLIFSALKDYPASPNLKLIT